MSPTKKTTSRERPSPKASPSSIKNSGAGKTAAKKTVAKKSTVTASGAKKPVAPAKERASKPAARARAAAQGKKTATKPSKKFVRATTDNVRAIETRLAEAIPQPECELNFASPFELLTATILAAQSTDKTVNQVMPTLLSHYPDAAALAKSQQEDVETLVKRTGFFRNKAKAIRGMAQHLVAEHGGQVPRTIERMVELPGVARKTANVVLGTAYGIPSGFVVDTHVTRVAARLALSSETDPVRIERDLCALLPKDTWVDMSHRLILHGRYTCLAKRPMCEDCSINELCPSRQAEPVEPWQERARRQDARTRAGLAASRGR